MENFNLEERGDLQDLVEHLESDGVEAATDFMDEIPAL